MHRLLAIVLVSSLGLSTAAFAQSANQGAPVASQSSQDGLDALNQAPPPPTDMTALLIGGGVAIGGAALIAIAVNNNRDDDNNTTTTTTTPPVSP